MCLFGLRVQDSAPMHSYGLTFYVTFATTGPEGGSYGTVVENPGPQQVNELLVPRLVGNILTTYVVYVVLMKRNLLALNRIS